MLLENKPARKTNSFEKMFLLVGIVAVILGYYFVHQVFLEYGVLGFESAAALLLWFILIFLLVLIAVCENSKEELKIIIGQQHEELRLLRNDFRRRR